MTWTTADVASTAELREAYFKDRLKQAEKAAEDAKYEQRLAMHECKFCFYFGHGLAGQAFTEYKCACCETEQMHSNTAVPRLCTECAEKLGACRRCGGTMEWKVETPKKRRSRR